MSNLFTQAAVVIFGFLSCLQSARADVLLTITGDIETASNGEALQFDRASLVEMGFETIETSTIWTAGVQVFEGVPLHKFATLFDMRGGSFLATAINNYSIEIPVSDAIKGGPIIALVRNGKDMSIRDKGPLWLVYPYDANPNFRTEVIYSRSIWQLERLEVSK